MKRLLRPAGLAGVLVAGAAHAEDIAVETVNVVRAEFTTRADPTSVERAACSLGAHAEVAGQDRPLEMRVEYGGKVVLCPVMGPNGLTILVRAAPGTDGAFHVVVQADVSAASADARKDLEQTLREVTAEIARRSEVQQPLQKPLEPPKPEVHFRPTRAYSPALTVTGIVVASLGFVALGAGYFWLAGTTATAQDPGPPVGMMAAGGGGILLGALFALVGEHRVPADQISAIPGGFRF